MLRRLLFRMAKSPLMGKMVGKAFQYCSWAIPVKRVYSSREILAFRHPQPSYENHLILSPKRAIRNLQQMASGGLDAYFVKTWEAAEKICAAHPEYRDAFVIVANGGKRQEVQQVHFHMFTGREMVNELIAAPVENIPDCDGANGAAEHPNPNWEIHFVVKPVPPLQTAEKDAGRSAYFKSVLHSIDLLNDQFGIVQKGYSLVCQYNLQKNDAGHPVFHIVSGKRIK